MLTFLDAVTLAASVFGAAFFGSMFGVYIGVLLIVPVLRSAFSILKDDQ